MKVKIKKKKIKKVSPVESKDLRIRKQGILGEKSENRKPGRKKRETEKKASDPQPALGHSKLMTGQFAVSSA